MMASLSFLLTFVCPCVKALFLCKGALKAAAAVAVQTLMLLFYPYFTNLGNVVVEQQFLLFIFVLAFPELSEGESAAICYFSFPFESLYLVA